MSRCRFAYLSMRNSLPNFAIVYIASFNSLFELAFPFCNPSIRDPRFAFAQMTSAKVRSVFRKYLMPLTTTSATTATERANPGQ